MDIGVSRVVLIQWIISLTFAATAAGAVDPPTFISHVRSGRSDFRRIPFTAEMSFFSVHFIIGIHDVITPFSE